MYQLQNYHGYPCKFDYQINYNCFNEPFAVSLYSIYTQTCMAQSLRQAYDYWQDQPGYYPRAAGRPKAASSKVVRFAKIDDSSAQRRHTGLIARRHVFMTCNQLDNDLQSIDQQIEVQFTSWRLRCKLASPKHVRAQQKQDLQIVDFQTLFTHNHTIICVPLKEGLRYSLRALHAEANCHKKIMNWEVPDES